MKGSDANHQKKGRKMRRDWDAKNSVTPIFPREIGWFGRFPAVPVGN